MSTDDPARSQIDEDWSDPSSELFPDLPLKPRASLPVASRTKSVPPPPPSASRAAAPLAAALIGSAGPNRKRSVPPPPPRARGAETSAALPLSNATPSDELELAQTSPGLGPVSALVSPLELDAEAAASDAVTVPLPEAALGPYALPSLAGPSVSPMDPSVAPASRAVADSSERVKTEDTDPSPESGSRKLDTAFDEELDDFGPEDFEDVKPRVVAEAAVKAEADDENLVTRTTAAVPLLDAPSESTDEPTAPLPVSGFKSGHTHSLPPLVAPRKPLAPPAPRASAAPASGSLPLPSILPPPSLPPLPPLPPLPSVPIAPASFAGSSIAPVALARGVALVRSLFPVVGQKARLARLWALDPGRRVAALSALALGGLALCTTLLVLIFGSDASAARGSLVVTVSGAGNAPVSSLAVLADDAVSCRTSPCKIADLDPGTHFVRVRAPGYQETAARAVSVQKGSEAVVHVQLTSAGQEPRAADEASVATRAVTDRDDTRAQAVPADLEQERSTSRRTPTQSGRVWASAATRAPAAEAQPAKAVKPGKPGTLNISSNPPSNVVLDGRPLGRTPRLGVQVAAGVHSVVFIHPQFGRKVQSASVAPGAARSVAVRFR